MLFHSSIRQELARSFGATFVVLITIVMTMTLIHTLGQATRGSINPADVIFIMDVRLSRKNSQLYGGKIRGRRGF